MTNDSELPTLILAWVFVGLLALVTLAKGIAGYYSASATSRLGNSAAQRSIAYGVMLPAVGYGLFVVSVFPLPSLDMGERTIASLVGMIYIAVASVCMAWGWRGYDHTLGEVFDRIGNRHEGVD